MRALWDRKDWLPNAVVENPANGHAHAVWALSEPVTRTEYAARKPLAYAAAVTEGLRRSVDGDAAYSGLITKNPEHGSGTPPGPRTTSTASLSWPNTWTPPATCRPRLGDAPAGGTRWAWAATALSSRPPATGPTARSGTTGATVPVCVPRSSRTCTNSTPSSPNRCQPTRPAISPTRSTDGSPPARACGLTAPWSTKPRSRPSRPHVDARAAPEVVRNDEPLSKTAPT